MPDFSACSTWRWPTVILARSRPSIITTTGGQSPRFSLPIPMATLTPLLTGVGALLPMPAVPDYDDSGHSVEGGAAAYVLKGFFKDDDIRFTACSLTLPLPEERCGGTSEVRRSFTSFTQAAEENGP